MPETFEIKIEMADGVVWVAVYDGAGDEFVAFRLSEFEDLMELRKVVEMAVKGDRQGILDAWNGIDDMKGVRP